MYSWHAVAERVERIYDQVEAEPWDDSFLARLERMYRCGLWAGARQPLSRDGKEAQQTVVLGL